MYNAIFFFKSNVQVLCVFPQFLVIYLGGKLHFRLAMAVLKEEVMQCRICEVFLPGTPRASRLLGISGHKNLSDSELEGLLYFISRTYPTQEFCVWNPSLPIFHRLALGFCVR